LEKEVVWTAQARADLQKIYEFNISSVGEEKAYALIDRLVSKADVLYEKIPGGTRYISSRNPEINYQKLIYGYYLIIFREEGNKVFVNKVFDARQDPVKLKL
jgi:plasmid stabilization system protein ParE